MSKHKTPRQRPTPRRGPERGKPVPSEHTMLDLPLPIARRAKDTRFAIFKNIPPHASRAVRGH